MEHCAGYASPRHRDRWMLDQAHLCLALWAACRPSTQLRCQPAVACLVPWMRYMAARQSPLQACLQLTSCCRVPALPASTSWSLTGCPSPSGMLQCMPIAAAPGVPSCSRFYGIHTCAMPSAGTLLQTFTFESALRAVTADPGEHTLYAGAVDGCIFAGDLIPGSSRPEAAGGPMQSSSAPVNCLACTPDATQLVAGEEDPSRLDMLCPAELKKKLTDQGCSSYFCQ